MEEKKDNDIFKNKKFWVILIIGLMGILWINNYNSLSTSETMDKFLTLLDCSEFERAKKYTTMNFDSNYGLTGLKKRELAYKESFTYSYGDYYLEDADIAYIDYKTDLLSVAHIVKFNVVDTIFGKKIDNYVIDIIDY